MFVNRLESTAALTARAMSDLIRAETTEPYGESVRIRRRSPTDPRPDHLYLVYISFNNEGLVVRHVEDDINPAQIDSAEDALIVDAKAGVNLVGQNFDLMRFDRPTNLSFVLDQDDWEFYYPDPSDPEPNYSETHDPIVFIGEKTTIDLNGNLVTSPATRNRSFYDLEPITRTIDGKPRKGIRCINHFTRNAAGDPVGNLERLKYSFNLFVRVPFSTTLTDKKITIILDPDGQNQGPP